LSIAAVILAVGTLKLCEEGMEKNRFNGLLTPATHTLYSKWSVKYGRMPNNPEEKNFRMRVFAQTLASVEEYRRIHSETKFGINKFADLTWEEKKTAYLGVPSVSHNNNIEVVNHKALGRAIEEGLQLIEPPNIHIIKGLRPARDQGSRCNSCWAFTIANMVETFFDGAIQVSPQHFIDCMYINPASPAKDPCQGANIFFNGLFTVLSSGYKTESVLPYRGRQGACSDAGRVAVSPSNVFRLVPNPVKSFEKQISVPLVKQMLSKYDNAIGVQINVNDAFFSYRSGVWSATCKVKAVNHALTLVGYDENYWYMMNSWGIDWGTNGYVVFKKYNDFSSNANCFCGGDPTTNRCEASVIVN